MRGAMAQLNGILANYLSNENEVEIFSFKRQYPKLLFPGNLRPCDARALFRFQFVSVLALASGLA